MQTFGGALFKPIAELICGIGDIVIEVLQNTFITYKTNILAPVKDTPTGNLRDYTIRYSPGIIFSGEVRALDINFINPKEDQQELQYKVRYEKIADTEEEAKELGILPDRKEVMQTGKYGIVGDKFLEWVLISNENGSDVATTYYWVYDSGKSKNGFYKKIIYGENNVLEFSGTEINYKTKINGFSVSDQDGLVKVLKEKFSLPTDVQLFNSEGGLEEGWKRTNNIDHGNYFAYELDYSWGNGYVLSLFLGTNILSGGLKNTLWMPKERGRFAKIQLTKNDENITEELMKDYIDGEKIISFFESNYDIDFNEFVRTGGFDNNECTKLQIYSKDKNYKLVIEDEVPSKPNGSNISIIGGTYPNGNRLYTIKLFKVDKVFLRK